MVNGVKCRLNIIIFLCLLFSINLVAAVPPIDTVFSGTTGIDVEVNIMPVYQHGEARFSIIHLSNATSGFQITNETHNNISCHLHLRDSQGFELMDVEAMPQEDYWFLNGSGGGANPVGEYAWTITCQDLNSEVGGYASGYFSITNTGKLFEAKTAVIVFALISLAFIFLILSFFFREDYWILKSFFQFLSVLAGLIGVNSAIIIVADPETLGVMGTSGLLLLIICVALFFLWIFVRAFKEIIKIFKDKGDLRWTSE